MNILYGVNATGNGHISRSRITISELKSVVITLPFFLAVERLRTFLILMNLDHTLLKKASPLYSKMEN